MKTRTLLWFFLLLTSNVVHGQTQPPVYEITMDTPVRKLPDAYWQMLADASGKLTINEVGKSPLADSFHTNNTKGKGIGYSGIKNYWIQLRLKNSTGKDQQLVFENFPRAMRFELYVFRSSGKIEKLVNGWIVPASQRDSFTRNAVPVKIGRDEEVKIFKHLQLYYPERYDELSIGFSFFEPFVKKTYIDEPVYVGDVRHAFIAGLLIFGFFLNIFFFWIVREKIYFYYSLLLLLEGIWYFTMGSFVFFRENPQLNEYFQLTFTHSVFFFSVTQFVRHFLKTFVYYPKWDKVLLILITLMIVMAWLSLFYDTNVPYSWKGIPDAFESLVFNLNMFALLATFLFARREKDRFTTLSVIAAVPAFFVWSFVYGMGSLYQFLDVRYGIAQPRILQWISQNSMVIEMFAVAWFAILFTWILLQRYSLLRKQYAHQALEREREKNDLMERQKVELENQVEERTVELKQSIDNLKATQQQLIQSEKMASLGELTAGIAHEIQNPLNFINNFSDVNTELIEEMEEEIEKGEIEEVKSIAQSIKENNQKITYHGKRADSIVKNMLQHSRKNSGQKEPADINALADEYLRLSYHGLRARDKSFNSGMKTEFDDTIGKVNVVGQDISRVLLNLFNNAFYSVYEKKKLLNGTYEPMVVVSTRKNGNSVEIAVMDNGLGISKSVIDKIYQPFFTTKPTGEGTGLGLSMSYEIIKKGHGGDLKVSSKEGEYAEFKIILPVE